METERIIRVGTVLAGKGSDMHVVDLLIYKNNQGKWDTMVVLEFLDPTLAARRTQVTLKELVKGLDSGGVSIKAD
jgi:hypothetical protein